MARKIQQRQKFYRRKRWLLSTSMFIILPAVLVIGYVKVSAFCGIYNSNSLLCQYQGGYTQVGGDWAKLTWSGGAIGSPGSPSDVSAGSTVSLTGSYNSVEPSNGQTVVGWVNISTGQPGAQSITAGGAPSYVFNNGCFAEVAQIPGKSGPAANPYGNNNWYSASGGSGVFACGSVENNPPRDTLSNQYPGYFATTYSNVDSTLNNGSPVGSSVVWNNGTSTAKTNTFNIKFSSSITQPIQVCMRYHVSITANPGAATDIAGGNANGIAKNDLSDIVAVAGQTDSASAACFLVHPNPPPTNISSCNNINVTDSGTNPATMISYSPVIAPDGSTVAPDGSSWSSDQNSKDTGTNGLVWTHTSVSVTGGGVNISTNLGHGYSSVGINQNFIPLSQTITVSINRREHLLTHKGNKYWVTYSTAGSGTYTCYSAHCTVDSARGDGPGGLIISGGTVHITATIINDNGPTNLNLYATVGGVPGQPPLSITDNGAHNVPTSGIPPGGSATITFDQTDGGGPPHTYSTSPYPDYNGGFVLGPSCSASSSLNGGGGCTGRSNGIDCPAYVPFTLTPSGSTKLLPIDENPTQTVDSTWVTGSGPPVSENVTSSLYNTTANCGSATVLSTSNPGAFSAGRTYIITTTPPNTYTYNTCAPPVAGDSYCATVHVPFATGGYVGPGGSGDIVGGSPADWTQCARVVNRPYFKVVGSSVSTGAGFQSGNTCPGGEIASWNNDSGIYPVSGNFGAGVQLGALAAKGIVGFASNQNIPGLTQLNSGPSRLNFANTGGVPFSRDDYSPQLGGYFGDTGSCLQTSKPANIVDGGNGSSANIGSLAATAASPGKSYSFSPSSHQLTLTNGSSTVSAGQSLAMYVNGDVYIDSGGITYNQGGTWTYKSVPSFKLVVYGNIYIDPAVTELDGLYSAQPDDSGHGGNIYTCSDTTNHFTYMDKSNLYSNCYKQLVVYGSFQAQQIDMMRTLGSLRDETPVAGINTGGQAGADQPLVWAPGCKQGICNSFQNTPQLGKCVHAKEPSESSAWAENYLCVPAGDGNPSDVQLSFTCDNFAPGNQNGCNTGTKLAYCTTTTFGNNNGFQKTVGIGGYIELDPWDYPKDRTWIDNYFCSNYPIRFMISGSNPTNSTQFCTSLSVPGDKDGNNVWQSSYICIDKYIVGTFGVGHGLTPPLTCSNTPVGYVPALRTTCAAEVFIYSPELDLGNSSDNLPSHGAPTYQAITSLPPVL